jgi:hypothetical protein
MQTFIRDIEFPLLPIQEVVARFEAGAFAFGTNPQRGGKYAEAIQLNAIAIGSKYYTSKVAELLHTHTLLCLNRYEKAAQQAAHQPISPQGIQSVSIRYLFLDYCHASIPA